MNTSTDTIPELHPIREIGSSCRGRILLAYDEVVSLIGEPNATDMDDEYKVKASWGFADAKGRKAFVWCYKYDDPRECEHWSCDGDQDLLAAVFGEALAA